MYNKRQTALPSKIKINNILFRQIVIAREDLESLNEVAMEMAFLR